MKNQAISILDEMALPSIDPATQDARDAERALVYHWISAQFAREPTPQLLAAYRSQDGRALLQNLAHISPLTPAVDDIALWIDDATEADLDIIARDLAADYAKLFLGAGGRRTAPPYRSFYAANEGRMIQTPAVDMQHIMQQLDIRMSDELPEPPDHIAVQLAVMAALVQTSSTAKQARFLGDHLLDWVDTFCARCIMVSAFGFYTSVARALVKYVHMDAKHLGR